MSFNEITYIEIFLPHLPRVCVLLYESSPAYQKRKTKPTNKFYSVLGIYLWRGVFYLDEGN